jgi:hypothetical protein
MVVRVINEIERSSEPSRRERFGRGARKFKGKNAILFGLTVCLAGAILYILLDQYSNKRVPVLVNTAVEPALQDRRRGRDAGGSARSTRMPDRWQLIGRGAGRKRTTSLRRKASMGARDGAAIDSRDPEMSKATEIHVATGLSDSQVKAVAAEVDTRVEPKFNALAATMGSHLDQKVQEITAQNRLTEAQLASLKTELVQSVKVALEEERLRNQQLWKENVMYRDLFYKSAELNQDLIALYAGRAKDDHALGNAVKVVPQLFTLKVWQNKDDKNQYLRLLSRYQEITSESQRLNDSQGQP